MRPHPIFSITRPDEVAETFSNVSDSLYQALWESMEGMLPISCQINIEECGPDDAIGLNCLASVWSLFTPKQQEELNALIP